MKPIKLKALTRLQELIECEVKELKGKICSGPSGRDHRLKFPSLSITTRRFNYLPNQADSSNYVTGSDYLASGKGGVFNVGDWQGTVELRLGAKTPSVRYDLENKIEQIFLGGRHFIDSRYPLADSDDCLRPGVVLIDVPECSNARIAYELEDDTWNNEKVFSNQWYSIMRVRATLPALVCKPLVHTMDNIRVKLDSNLDTVTDFTFQVNEDGTITEI